MKRDRISEGNTVREKKKQDLGILQKTYHNDGKSYSLLNISFILFFSLWSVFPSPHPFWLLAWEPWKSS